MDNTLASNHGSFKGHKTLSAKNKEITLFPRLPRRHTGKNTNNQDSMKKRNTSGKPRGQLLLSRYPPGNPKHNKYIVKEQREAALSIFFVFMPYCLSDRRITFYIIVVYIPEALTW